MKEFSPGSVTFGVPAWNSAALSAWNPYMQPISFPDSAINGGGLKKLFPQLNRTIPIIKSRVSDALETFYLPKFRDRYFVGDSTEDIIKIYDAIYPNLPKKYQEKIDTAQNQIVKAVLAKKASDASRSAVGFVANPNLILIGGLVLIYMLIQNKGH